MSKPEDIPQDVWNKGAKWAGEYYSWLNAGNSTGSLSEHAVTALADSFARAIQAAVAAEREACMSIVFGSYRSRNERCFDIINKIRQRGQQ